MFVGIEDFKSVLAIENLLTPYKRGMLSPDKKSYLPKEPITPDICWEVLRSTNAPRSINDMLSCIADLPPSEQAQFKEVVLSTFDNREQPDKKPYNIVLLGRKLAQASGYEKELAEVLKPKNGEFLLSDAKGSRGYRNRVLDLTDDDIKRFECFECANDEFLAFQKKSLSHQLWLPKAERVYFTDCNFEGVNALRFHPEALVFMNDVSHLPEKLDVSTCKYFVVKPDMLPMIQNWTFSENGLGLDMRRSKPSGNLDLSQFGYVNLMQSDLKGVSAIHFRDGAVVILREVKYLPKNIDFSKCVKLDLGCCDLGGQQELSLRDSIEVDLDTAKNLPLNIDFSKCVKVNLSGCDLKGQSSLRFDEAKVVYLEQVEIKQKILNFPKCEDLNLQGSCLLPKTKLYFPMATEINFSFVTNLPDNIDVSHCAKVNLKGCDLKNQSNLCFADGAEVDLYKAENLPKNLDFSCCAKVLLGESDLRNQSNLHFAEGANVALYKMKYLPKNLDFSSCAVLDLIDCNLKNQPNLSFRDEAEVNLNNSYNLPKVLDFSSCSRVRLAACELYDTQAIVFKNKEQYESSDMGVFVKEDMKIFFADKMSDDDWKEIQNLKKQRDIGLKNVWHNMTILWGDRRD